MDNRTTNRAVGEDVDLVQTEDGHHKFVDAETKIHPERAAEEYARKHFVVGAQVELKSGGPVMTVEEWEPLNDAIVHLCWFVGGTLVRDAVHFSMLKLAGVVLEKRPVAWRVGDLVFVGEKYANEYVEANGGKIEGLYLRDGT